MICLKHKFSYVKKNAISSKVMWIAVVTPSQESFWKAQTDSRDAIQSLHKMLWGSSFLLRTEWTARYVRGGALELCARWSLGSSSLPSSHVGLQQIIMSPQLWNADINITYFINIFKTFVNTYIVGTVDSQTDKWTCAKGFIYLLFNGRTREMLKPIQWGSNFILYGAKIHLHCQTGIICVATVRGYSHYYQFSIN